MPAPRGPGRARRAGPSHAGAGSAQRRRRARRWRPVPGRLPAGAPVPAMRTVEQLTEADVEFARLVTHYWSHDGFVADWAVRWGAEPGSGLLGGMHRLAGIPGVLIHGRRDVSGPVRTPFLVHRAWPGSTLQVVEGEGHGGPQMVRLWCEAMDQLTGPG